MRSCSGLAKKSVICFAVCLLSESIFTFSYMRCEWDGFVTCLWTEYESHLTELEHSVQ